MMKRIISIILIMALIFTLFIPIIVSADANKNDGFDPLRKFVNFLINCIQIVLSILIGLIIAYAALQQAIPDGWGGRGGGRNSIGLITNCVKAELILNIGLPIIKYIINKGMLGV